MEATRETKKDQWVTLASDDAGSGDCPPASVLHRGRADGTTGQRWGLIEEYFYPISKSIRRKCSEGVDAALSIEEQRFPNKQSTASNSNPSSFSIPSSFQDKDSSDSGCKKAENELES